MKIGKLNVFLLILFILSVIGNWTVGRDYSRPNFIVMPEMVQSPAYKSFAANPVFPDGKTLRRPVSGTIARGDMPLHYDRTPEDASRAGEELLNPYSTQASPKEVYSLLSFPHFGPLQVLPFLVKASDKESSKDMAVLRRRGTLVYANFCQICHGPTGKGDGPVSVRGVPPPPSLLAENAVKMKDGKMFHVITFGQGNMAPYAAQIGRKDRWLAILHIRALQKRGTPTRAEGKE